MVHKKSQTSTEYLIILAVVIVISIIVVSILGGIPSIGGSLSKNSKLSELRTANVGIDNYYVNTSYAKILVRNNNAYNINLQDMMIDNITCITSELPTILTMGETKIVECSGSFTDYSTTNDIPEFGYKYTDMVSSAQYSNTYYSENTSVPMGGVSSCPEDWVLVPGNTVYGTENFCMMKSEAADISGVPTPMTAQRPWYYASQETAISACESLGEGYHLMTNAEWMTVARNVEQVAQNWNSSVVGEGYIYTGYVLVGANRQKINHTDDNDGYFLTGETSGPMRRTLYLSTGEVIWDFLGNLGESLNDTIDCSGGYPCTNIPYSSFPALEWVEYKDLATWGQFSQTLIGPSDISWHSTNKIGLVYTDPDTATGGGTTHTMIRGGSFLYGEGLYSLLTTGAPDTEDNFIGFRCSYTE